MLSQPTMWRSAGGREKSWDAFSYFPQLHKTNMITTFLFFSTDSTRPDPM
jgi:hypothetical protein